MSPEQVEGKEVDQRSDIYSLGVILYEMMTGRVPFEGETPLGIAMKHKSEMPQDPSGLNAQIPDDLSRAILRCLEKDKEKRFQSAEEVLSELEKIEKGIPTTERVVPKRKPITSKEITVTFGLKKLFIPALAVIAIVIAAVVILQLLPQKEAIPIPSDKPSLAIVFFENISSDESLEGWRTGLSELLITDLSQSKLVNVLSSDRIFSILKKQNLLDTKKYSSEDLVEVAEEGRVSHIVKGGLIKADGNIIITATLHNTQTGEIISSKRLECRGENEIFSRVDELTKEIKLALNLSSEQIISDIDKTIGKITTSSPEAYKYYMEGRKIFQSDPHKSIAFMKRAIDIDPEFAMAYRSMAMSYANMGYGSETAKYIKKAFELSDRVSDREKYQIQGAFYWGSEETFDKAIESYSNLLELYPDDSTGNLNLGCVYSNIEEWDKAIDRIEIHKRISPESANPYGWLTFVFGTKGMYDKSREILDEYLENFPDNANIRRYSAGNYLLQGNYKLALAEADKGLFLNPSDYRNIIVKGDTYLCDGEFIKSEKEYLKLLELDEKAAHRVGRRMLGALYLSQGKFKESEKQLKHGVELARKLEEKEWEPEFHLDLAYRNLKTGNPDDALKEIEKAWTSAVETEIIISTQINALHLKGLIHLEMRPIEEAQKSADQLKESIEKWINKKLMRYYYHLQGKIELKRENYSGAIELFKKAMSLLSFQSYPSQGQALFIDSLALAYYKSGDLERAREEYERITKLTTGRLFYGDIYAKSFYMLGKIYEQKGDKGKAIEHYEKFLDLWKDADHGIPEVEDAKKRLAGLKSQ
jgi:tetratricopeptide (TPR) repeat protein